MPCTRSQELEQFGDGILISNCLDHSHYTESYMSASSTKTWCYIKHSNKLVQISNVKNGRLFNRQGKPESPSHHLN